MINEACLCCVKVQSYLEEVLLFSTQMEIHLER